MSDRFEFETWETPEAAGVSSAALLKFLDEAERAHGLIQFHSMVLLRHGKVVARFNWAPYDDRTPHTLFSLSKSFCSAAAGFAVQEGLIAWDTSVADALADEIPAGHEDALRPITLETLLCMGSGLDPASDSIPEDDTVTWARHVLSHDVQYPPMTHFHYNTLGTYLVACMLERATGTDLVSYLKPRLFDPLDIPAPAWDTSPQGVCCGGFGLYLSADSIARFGQCLLDKGKWQGLQVLPAGWVERATAKHIDNSNGQPDPDNEWAQGYGYQFWRCTEGRYRGDGMYGQLCVVNEQRDAVLAVTCATNDMGAELRLIREHLLPALDTYPGTAANQEALAARSETLAFFCPADDGTARPLPEGDYVFDTPWGGEDSMSLHMLPDRRVVITFSGQLSVELGLGRWLTTDLSVHRQAMRWLGAYGWREGKLLIDLRTPDGPNTLCGAADWDDDTLTFDGVGMEFPNGQIVFRKQNAQ